MRVACLLVEYFVIQLHTLESPALAGRPVVIGNQTRGVVDASHEAVASGVIVGMTLSQALPRAKDAVLIEPDEFGHVPLIVWAATWARLKQVLKELYVIVKGRITRREGTLNVIVEEAQAIGGIDVGGASSHDWR